MAALETFADLPLSVELPLRRRRGPDAQPMRARQPLPIAEIEAAIGESLLYIGGFAL